MGSVVTLWGVSANLGQCNPPKIIHQKLSLFDALFDIKLFNLQAHIFFNDPSNSLLTFIFWWIIKNNFFVKLTLSIRLETPNCPRLLSVVDELYFQNGDCDTFNNIYICLNIYHLIYETRFFESFWKSYENIFSRRPLAALSLNNRLYTIFKYFLNKTLVTNLCFISDCQIGLLCHIFIVSLLFGKQKCKRENLRSKSNPFQTNRRVDLGMLKALLNSPTPSITFILGVASVKVYILTFTFTKLRRSSTWRWIKFETVLEYLIRWQML